jgi:hypothetical protein
MTPVHRPISEPRTRWRAFRDYCQAFGPAVIAPAVSLATISNFPYIGIIVALLLLSVRRYWWTCIFGLAVWGSVFTSAIVSLLACARSWGIH